MDDTKKSPKRPPAPTLPAYLKDVPEAAKEFRQVVKYLKGAGDLDKVDSTAIAVYAMAASEVKKFDLLLITKGYTIVDKNGSVRRRPEVMMRKEAKETVVQYAKLLGIDRYFREKGREKATSLGKPMDKFARLRKVG